MKHLIPILLLLMLLCTAALAEENIIPPAWEVPDYVQALLEVARGELGYQEQAHGWTKYGEWAGDGYAQWCAEYLCWCVDQVDQQQGTQLLKNVYPKYSGSNTGRSWFINHGRYIARNGHLEDWGYQWLKGTDHFLRPGDYIPQPGDWVFFTWTNNTDTDHVAMVEYCTREKDNSVTIHVLEGNNPKKVQRNTYALTYQRILGFGTVHDVADWTLKAGYSGEKVRQLQEKLIFLGLLAEESTDGRYGSRTAEAVRTFQQANQLRANGVANIHTQNAIDAAVAEKRKTDPAIWQVTADEDDPTDLSDLLSDFMLPDF